MTIQEFPLAWRWTKVTHAILPSDVLARIRPLSPEEAAQIYKPGNLRNDKTATFCPADYSVRNWLRHIQPDSQAAIFISWGRDLAVETNWEIFTEYWDDFFYPSSDDVTVIPVAGA